MASDLNRALLIGRLTRDPEIRYIPAGTAIASFTIASNRTYSVSGERKEQVSYFDCIAWAKLGEVITEYCKKGHRIAVEGRLQQTRWDDQDGKKRSRVEVVVESFQFLNTAAKGQGEDIPNEIQGKSSESNNDYAESSSFEQNPFSDDDIPF
jgi:single-strand DNA-binding protein